MSADRAGRIAESTEQSKFINSTHTFLVLTPLLWGRVMRERILLIEDDSATRELMRVTLAQNGYEVSMAEDGVRGYDAALLLKPDLIVTGIQMPGADGIHVVRRVRDTASIENTPILVTTTFGTGAATFSLQVGANAFEPKPINQQSFLSTVKRLLADVQLIRSSV